jgi:hypothetical protein
LPLRHPDGSAKLSQAAEHRKRRHPRSEPVGAHMSRNIGAGRKLLERSLKAQQQSHASLSFMPEHIRQDPAF